MIPGSANLLLATAGSGTYRITRSLRFNSADSTSLSRTIADGDKRTFTWAGWVKRSGFTQDPQVILVSGTNAQNCSRLIFTSNSLSFVEEVGGVVTAYRTTTAVYRDPAAWMHIVLAVDTNQGTPANRIKLYVNGTEVTVFSVSSNPTPGQLLQVNTGTFYYGRSYGGSDYLDAYLADVHFINGLALTPTSFGEFDQTTGEWTPIAYAGSYGTNGHKLTFSDNSNTTATTLGADTSGNGNNFTPSGLSVTAGVGNDSLVDTPTSYGTDTGLGGEVRGNYCTLNSISNIKPASLGNGNLDYTSSTLNEAAVGTFGMSSGSWYWELVSTAGQMQVGVYGTTVSSLAGAPTANTVYGYRFNATAGTLDFTTNGSSWTSIATGLTSGPYVPYFNTTGTTAKTVSVNFGQRPFTYTAPSGYKALCDTNMSAPVIADPRAVMDAVIYTGNGAGRTISTSVTIPSLVWIKGRSSAFNHYVYDAVRGATNALSTNTTDAEFTLSGGGGLLSFIGNGFTIGSNSAVNGSSSTYVAWCWNGGLATGIQIASYTGNGTNRTISHALGTTPSLIIIKQRTSASATNWAVWHKALAGTEYLLLNSSAAKATGSTYWNSTLPTSSVFSLGTSGDVNTNTGAYIAYLFAPVAGYSAFGSYTGNGLADGTFVHTGFRPRWIMIKQITAASATGWVIFDASREGYNANNNLLAVNTASAEILTSLLDITSTGFKVRSTGTSVNASASATYVYAAFAEAPFQYARAR